jgi:hypothetical protein
LRLHTIVDQRLGHGTCITRWMNWNGVVKIGKGFYIQTDFKSDTCAFKSSGIPRRYSPHFGVGPVESDLALRYPAVMAHGLLFWLDYPWPCLVSKNWVELESNLKYILDVIQFMRSKQAFIPTGFLWAPYIFTA